MPDPTAPIPRQSEPRKFDPDWTVAPGETLGRGFVCRRRHPRRHDFSTDGLGFVIYPRYHWGLDVWYIDLSVMPRRRKRAA